MHKLAAPNNKPTKKKKKATNAPEINRTTNTQVKRCRSSRWIVSATPARQRKKNAQIEVPQPNKKKAFHTASGAAYSNRGAIDWGVFSVAMASALKATGGPNPGPTLIDQEKTNKKKKHDNRNEPFVACANAKAPPSFHGPLRVTQTTSGERASRAVSHLECRKTNASHICNSPVLTSNSWKRGYSELGGDEKRWLFHKHFTRSQTKYEHRMILHLV